MDKNNGNKSTGLDGLSGESKTEFLRLIWNSTTYQICLAKMVFDNHGAPVDYIILDINPAYEKAFGIVSFERQTGLADIVGKRASELLPNLDEYVRNNIQRVADTGEPSRTESYIADLGHWYSYLYSCVGGAGSQFITSVFVDITERKRAEEALQNERQRFFDVLETLPVDICLITPDYRVPFGNRAFREKFGESNGRHCYDFCYGFTEPCKFCESFEPFKTGKPHKWIFTSMDGKIITNVYAFPFKDTDGSPLVLEMHVDITDSMRAEEVLNKSNEALRKANEMKDEFISLVSHEFRTPLTVINSAVQAMRLICKDELSEKGNRFLKNILQNSNRQLKLVNNLLDIIRINAGKIKINLTNIDIILMTRTITESIIIFAEQKGIRLSFSSTLGEKIIGIDEEKYERILLNLLSNAIKFTPRGKSIFVRASQKIVKGKCKVCIQVKDQGIGIPLDNQQHIFERFGQVDSSLSRQAEGTGIGLTLVKMFVENMGGDIILESMIGKGSTFTVMFPVKKIKEIPKENKLMEINDNRLIQATAIEFSDIY